MIVEKLKTGKISEYSDTWAFKINNTIKVNFKEIVNF